MPGGGSLVSPQKGGGKPVWAGGNPRGAVQQVPEWFVSSESSADLEGGAAVREVYTLNTILSKLIVHLSTRLVDMHTNMLTTSDCADQCAGASWCWGSSSREVQLCIGKPSFQHMRAVGPVLCIAC